MVIQMQPLHLIVHEEILREELLTDNPLPERKVHLESVLRRINHIKRE